LFNSFSWLTAAWDELIYRQLAGTQEHLNNQKKRWISESHEAIEPKHINEIHTQRWGFGELSPMGAMRSCSTSRSWVLRGGSWGKDGAGGLCESTKTFCSMDNPSVENARDNLGRVHI
jgi:hypothetical protein